MKYLVLILSLIISIQTLHSQEEKKGFPFFNGSFNVSLALNENFTIENDDQALLHPSAIMMRAGFGYQFNKKLGVSFNLGYDYHHEYVIEAIPTYILVKYNILERDGDAFFTEYGQGKMWRHSSKFPDGNYYTFGVGWQINTGSRWKPVIHMKYHRKKIVGFQNGNLDSISLGVGFSFF